MAIRCLTSWNDPIFRKKSRAVEKFDERLWTLLDDMKDTLVKANGYGCAVVHVGGLRRVVIVNDENGVIEFINPIIIEVGMDSLGVQINQEVLEGSIAPGAPRGYVTRPQSVTVSAYGRNGKPITVNGSGFLVATYCH